ncbi:MAG: helix-turn-helix domain-containing protein [Gordonia sp. (in: high G+C Gram-positive bacteria)]
MNEPHQPAASRRYRSSLRAQQAEQTRGLIAKAAHESFVAHGWAGTSVRAIATAAGVSEATVYSTFSSKAGLALALIDGVDAQAGVREFDESLTAAAGDPARQIAACVAFDRRLFEHGGAVIRVIRDGRRDHAELGAAYDEGRRRGDRVRREVFASWPPSTWRTGMDLDRALDVYAAISSLDTFDVLRHERDWTPDEIEDWWRATLVEALLGTP